VLHKVRWAGYNIGPDVETVNLEMTKKAAHAAGSLNHSSSTWPTGRHTALQPGLRKVRRLGWRPGQRSTRRSEKTVRGSGERSGGANSRVGIPGIYRKCTVSGWQRPS